MYARCSAAVPSPVARGGLASRAAPTPGDETAVFGCSQRLPKCWISAPLPKCLPWSIVKPAHGPAAQGGLRRGARRRRRARRAALRPKEAPHRDAVHRRGLPARRPLLAGDDLRRHALRERPPPRDARRSRRGVPRPRRWSNDETPGTKLAGKSFEVQATAALQNLRAVLEAAGASPKQLVSVRAGVPRPRLFESSGDKNRRATTPGERDSSPR